VPVTNSDIEFTDLTVAGGDGRRATITGTQNHPFS
jgi:hypothetical protein